MANTRKKGRQREQDIREDENVVPILRAQEAMREDGVGGSRVSVVTVVEEEEMHMESILSRQIHCQTLEEQQLPSEGTYKRDNLYFQIGWCFDGI